MKLQLLEKSKIFYHGSPYKLEYLKEGCDFTYRPANVSLELKDFEEFYEERKKY